MDNSKYINNTIMHRLHKHNVSDNLVREFPSPSNITDIEAKAIISAYGEKALQGYSLLYDVLVSSLEISFNDYNERCFNIHCNDNDLNANSFVLIEFLILALNSDLKPDDFLKIEFLIDGNRFEEAQDLLEKTIEVYGRHEHLVKYESVINSIKFLDELQNMDSDSGDNAIETLIYDDVDAISEALYSFYLYIENNKTDDNEILEEELDQYKYADRVVSRIMKLGDGVIMMSKEHYEQLKGVNNVS